MLRVLIGEDEWLVAFTLRGQLEEQGCEVVGIARTGSEVLEATCLQRPEVVVMDITMPDMDGLEATRRIMQECPTCVVMLTAHGASKHVLEAEKAGAMAYLVKPAGGAQLRPAIELALGRFQEFLALFEELGNLDEVLQTRKSLERAKSILMKRANFSEAEAFRQLKQQAANSRLTLRAVAESIIRSANSY